MGLRLAENCWVCTQLLRKGCSGLDLSSISSGALFFLPSAPVPPRTWRHTLLCVEEGNFLPFCIDLAGFWDLFWVIHCPVLWYTGSGPCLVWIFPHSTWDLLGVACGNFFGPRNTGSALWNVFQKPASPCPGRCAPSRALDQG